MKGAELIGELSGRMNADYVRQLADQVLDAKDVDALYAIATAQHAELPIAMRHKILSNSAYLLETLYFKEATRFRPSLSDFFSRGFVTCVDASARRHFAKIMADLLLHERPDRCYLEQIAETAADWAVCPTSKIAVRIWSVEILKNCREIPWVADLWPDLLETMRNESTAGILCRLHKSWR